MYILGQWRDSFMIRSGKTLRSPLVGYNPTEKPKSLLLLSLALSADVCNPHRRQYHSDVRIDIFTRRQNRPFRRRKFAYFTNVISAAAFIYRDLTIFCRGKDARCRSQVTRNRTWRRARQRVTLCYALVTRVSI